MDSKYLIETLKNLHATKGKSTKKYFRKHTGIPDAAWEEHFGTFLDFKRAAGLHQGRLTQRHLSHVAKQSSLDNKRKLTFEKRQCEGKYLRPSNSKYATIMTISDVHDIHCDPFTREVFIDSLKRVKPEYIVLNGDIVDLPDFSRYSNDPREFKLVEGVEWLHKFLAEIRNICPDAELTYIEGNHECVEENTEVLTSTGWVLAKNIDLHSFVAQVSLENQELSYSLPLAVATSEQPLVSITGDLQEELVSESHSIILGGERVKVTDVLGELDARRFWHKPENHKRMSVELTDNKIRLLTWIISEDCTYLNTKFDKMIEFRLTNVKKVKELSKLLESLDLPYIEDNKVLRLHPDPAWWVFNELGPVKTFPANWCIFTPRQIELFLDTLNRAKGFSKENADLLQRILFSGGVSSKVIKKTGNEPSYTIHYGREAQGRVQIKRTGTKGNVVSIQTREQTLVTRRNGKISITGNCRLLKYLSEDAPALKVLLSDIHGFTIPKLLGIDKYEVNYVAPADLATLTKADEAAELRKNYSLVAGFVLHCHYPQAKNLGYPGMNGHHHKHHSHSLHNGIFGSYEWHQLGSAHKREAGYCDGSKWSTGFMLTHVNLVDKRAQFEYIDTTNRHCVVGGKWYLRK